MSSGTRQEVLGKLRRRYQGAGAEHRRKLIDQAGDFSESAASAGMERHRHGPPQTWIATEPDRHSAGPLGDRSLPRRASGCTLGFFDKLSLT